MPIAFAVQETIERPVDDVWAALTDWTNAPHWMSGIEKMQAGGETSEGTALTFHSRGAERSSLIVHCDPGRSITLRSVQGNVTADYAYELHPESARSTRVALTANCQSRGFLWSALSPFLRIAIRKVDGNQLKNLKQYVES